jgi:hypothetical protein
MSCLDVHAAGILPSLSLTLTPYPFTSAFIFRSIMLLLYYSSSVVLSRGDLGGVVLDMRNNGGGLLQGAVETANLLLPPGTRIEVQR